MCEIKLLVIGYSAKRNRQAVQNIKNESVKWDKNVKIVIDEFSPVSSDAMFPEEYDIAMVDEKVISKGCSKMVLGSGVPVLTFGESSHDENVGKDVEITLSSVVKSAVEKGCLRDYIVRVTEDINEIHDSIMATSSADL